VDVDSTHLRILAAGRGADVAQQGLYASCSAFAGRRNLRAEGHLGSLSRCAPNVGRMRWIVLDVMRDLAAKAVRASVAGLGLLVRLRDAVSLLAGEVLGVQLLWSP